MLSLARGQSEADTRSASRSTCFMMALYHANGLFVKRTVYLIDVDGKIRFGRRGMPSPDEVMAALK